MCNLLAAAAICNPTPRCVTAEELARSSHFLVSEASNSPRDRLDSYMRWEKSCRNWTTCTARADPHQRHSPLGCSRQAQTADPTGPHVPGPLSTSTNESHPTSPNQLMKTLLLSWGMASLFGFAFAQAAAESLQRHSFTHSGTQRVVRIVR